MAAATVQTAAKSSKKKAPKAIERTDSPAPSTASGSADKADGQDGFESPYIKELHKNIRNTNKKIANAAKTDDILAQHKGKSLNDLVAAKIINADQKAQIEKKPALQAQLAQFEEQLAQYQKVHDQYAAKANAEKAHFEKSLEQAKAAAVKEAKEEFGKSFRDNLLVLSQFLRLAAYRREEGSDPDADETQAIEGVLLAIYAGDASAVSAMEKLVGGTEEQVVSVPGEQLQSTYAAVKSLAQNYTVPGFEQAVESEAAPVVVGEAVVEDGNHTAAATVVADPATNAISEVVVAEETTTAAPANQWGSNDLSISQEWVDVKAPANPTEVDAGRAAQSWADDQPDTVTEAKPVDANDGFHQVQRNRGRQEREGNGSSRGGRGRGEFRGRGRGDGGRGRGRGNRNSGLPSRGPRRNEE
ncbi:hypothetical protein K4F52_000448 [Lecanicillium sp. MT-2017a]|nr:hypothetical protein K4F52_000448 [Lecanicillium sp. MT-2017a]